MPRTLWMAALCLSGCSAPAPWIDERTLVTVRPTLATRQFDHPLLDTGELQAQLGVGVEVGVAPLPIAAEARVAVGHSGRYQDEFTAFIDSQTVEGQLGLVLRPVWSRLRAVPSLGAGLVAGYVDADRVVASGGQLFGAGRVQRFDDTYSGVYLRGALDIVVDPATSVRFEATRYEDLAVNLGAGDTDLDGWSFGIAVSIRL